jgi:tRNA A-37 threonylcarbamoyl transferase component Bud32
MPGADAGFTAGRASRIHVLDDGTLLRLGGRPAEEAAVMALAREHGIRVPAVHEVREDGLVLERIDGPTMAQHLRRHPWHLRGSMRALVALHARLHAIPFGGDRLVHFDLHPENVILGPDGPVLIDWTNARSGTPESDVALTWLILETSGGLPGRVAARLFRAAAGRDTIQRGLADAVAFRLADRHVTDAERARVRRATP